MASKYAGRSTRRYRQLSHAQRLKALPCWLCGQPIRYDQPWPHPDAYTTDHVVPLGHAPWLAEDPTNFRSAHHHCNSSRGTKTPTPGIGTVSEEW